VDRGPRTGSGREASSHWLLPEHGRVLVLEGVVRPPEAVPAGAIIVGGVEELGPAEGRVAEYVGEGPFSAPLDGVEAGVYFLAIGVAGEVAAFVRGHFDPAESVEGGVGLFVDVPGEEIALLGRPRLLVTRAATVVVEEWVLGVGLAGGVAWEVPLALGPAAPGGDVDVVSPDDAVGEAGGDEVAGVVAGHPCIEVGEADISGGFPGDPFG
jgi:hypothetical protein